MRALSNFIIIASILGLPACSSVPGPDTGLILEQNIVPVSISEPIECRKKKMVYAADGSLWIK